ncbi:hypothetical protein GCM10009678_81700 [Actinomadura kijaniata]|uniref:SCO6045-like C-terminal domain-containing protein n=1 Tax=Actinomadura namibiensis TaxID=182080 RepID=A0A7W3LSI6_ACTNM|nr:hypothetical protein [Actinomadura namibiensis]MBA8953509.1 hypothetical protein [Actinomadura namibiensis]
MSAGHMSAGDTGAGDPGGTAELAARQEALVRAMTAGGPLPPGFDAAAVRAAADAILRKRAGEVARAWPALAACYGDRWRAAFTAWAAERPTRGSFRDSWDFARAHRDELSPAVALELALRETRWDYDGTGEPRLRKAAFRRVPGGFAVQVRGRLRVFGKAARR